MADNITEVLTHMKERFDPDSWGGGDAVLVFDISGDNGGQWVARIEGGKLSVSKGAAENADMTMSCSDTDLMAMVKGDLNAVSAFMQGKVKIDGNMSLAMKLQSLLGA